MILDINTQHSISVDSLGQFVAHYKELTLRSVFQPIFSRCKEVVGVEALVRIFNHDNEQIRPDEFFHASHVDQDDKQNVENLSRAIHIRNYSISNFNNVTLFLNVLPSTTPTFIDKKYIENNEALTEKLSELGINHEQVVLEIMEIEYKHGKTLASATRKLSEYGFRIAIDDFGVRASNVGRVHLLSPDIVKLDRSLLLKYMKGNHSPLLNGLSLAKEKNALTVIEGIETQEQLHAMEALDIDMHQGFFLGLPQ
jgi:EAL domain-containing protein (putative c-di-GMP-specific phosphodiesterase class I)